MFPTNPAVVTDPQVLGFMHMMVIGRTPSERPANIDAEIAARAADVEAGYAAFYREQGGSPEIGVYALRMKTPPPSVSPFGLPPQQVRTIKGSVAIFYWSDARADAPDLGCFDVVRRHIEGVEFR